MILLRPIRIESLAAARLEVGELDEFLQVRRMDCAEAFLVACQIKTEYDARLLRAFYSQPYPKPSVVHTDPHRKDGGLLTRRRIEVLLSEREWAWWEEQARRHHGGDHAQELGSSLAVAARCWVAHNESLAMEVANARR